MRYRREDIFERDDWTCQCCGAYVGLPGKQAQIAHKIPNTIAMRRKYGSDVVNDEENVMLVCSLDCNNRVQIGNNPVLCEAVVEMVKLSVGGKQTLEEEVAYRCNRIGT